MISDIKIVQISSSVDDFTNVFTAELKGSMALLNPVQSSQIPGEIVFLALQRLQTYRRAN
jgi:hypothetical protein